MTPPSFKPLYLAGPTAAGKSEAAILLAEKFGAEIISVDSMLVYRGMDIGTAKPSPGDRARVPHHLLDVSDVSETFDAARFVTLAREAERRILAIGRRVLYCGGTGLYFKALLEGLGESPPTDAAVRAELEQTSPEKLLQELAEKDPATFAVIDRQNLRRVFRALEVIRLSGQPYSALKAQWRLQTDQTAPPQIIVLRRSQADLHHRINLRVEEMFQAGLVAEVTRLIARGLPANRNAMQALGYRQVVEHLQGQRDLLETIALIKQRTRRFSKRQMTWFRNQAGVEWVDITSDADAGTVATQVENTATFQSLGWSETRSQMPPDSRSSPNLGL